MERAGLKRLLHFPPANRRNLMTLPASFAVIILATIGGGISRERLEKIFRPFCIKRKNGTGLGLSLSRRIISQQGGTLTADCGLKEGSRNIIRLPMGEAVVESAVLKS